jgi:hypothetical protein
MTIAAQHQRRCRHHRVEERDDVRADDLVGAGRRRQWRGPREAPGVRLFGVVEVECPADGGQDLVGHARCPALL